MPRWLAAIVLAVAASRASPAVLTELQVLSDPNVDVADGLVVSPDGAHVLVSSARTDLAVLDFLRDSATGALTSLETETVPAADFEVGDPRHALAISPDGTSVYVTYGAPGFDLGAVALLSRNTSTGALTWVESAATWGGPKSVAVSPDGANVLTTGHYVQVMTRDPGTGSLTFLENQVNTLYGARATVVTPDGTAVFIPTGDSLSSFVRYPSTGSLALAEYYDRGTPGYRHGYSAAAVSPDGRHLYVTSSEEGTVTVFARGPFESLSFVEWETNHSVGFGGLDGANSVALSPDGKTVYVTGSASNSLLMFSRSAKTGRLALRQAAVQGVGSVDGLMGAAAVAPSPDGAHIYVAGSGADAVAVFGFTSLCPAAPLPGCRTAGRSTFTLKDYEDDDVDRVVFRWLLGEETQPGDFGPPTNGTTGYALCAYDANGSIVDTNAPATGTCHPGACWSSAGSGFSYRSTLRQPDGLRSILLGPGPSGGAKVIVSGKGSHLHPVAPPFTPPLTVQVMTSLGQCWSTTFDAGDVKRNAVLPGRPGVFKATH